MSATRLSLPEIHDLIAAALIRSRTSAANAASVATARSPGIGGTGWLQSLGTTTPTTRAALAMSTGGERW